MRLYSGTTVEFAEDAAHNRIAEKLRSAFKASFRYEPGPAEVNSWRNSLRAMALVFERAHLKDNGVILEYQLPAMSRRLDCMITGRDREKSAKAVIVELKQWDKCEDTEGESILTFTGGAKRDVLHPSVQVGGYRNYLADSHTAFHLDADPIGLSACSYLHNYSFEENDPLLAPKFESWIEEFPVFSADDTADLIDDLNVRLGMGGGMPILDRVEQSKYKPGRRLLEHVAQMIDGRPEYVLLDEQLIAFDRVISAARAAKTIRRKSVILVVGGPGTGKSVIALNLVAKLASEGISSHYATGSSAFTQTLRQIVGRRASSLFHYFNSYTTLEPGSLDVVICDEAHRLRKTSSNRYTPATSRTGKAQIQELIDVAQTAVFFIDDRQLVRPDEIGSTRLIREASRENSANFHEIKLEAQFRCSGSDAFIQWVDNTLELERTPTILWNLQDAFEFRILDSPEALDGAVRSRLVEGFKARLTAGYCWPWSDPAPDRTLVDDINLGKFSRPWNAKPDATGLAKGIPKAPLWAYSKGGENQVGCIYTAQGFEFDYVGVIFGTDLVYRSGHGWIGQREHSYDTPVKKAGDRFAELVKNTYRVLLTRGLKGCYVYFQDKETETFVRSRTERTAADYDEPQDAPKLRVAEDGINPGDHS